MSLTKDSIENFSKALTVWASRGGSKSYQTVATLALPLGVGVELDKTQLNSKLKS